MYQVLKRDGGTVEFEISKISNAMIKAFEAQNRQYHPSIINLLALQVCADFESKIKELGFLVKLDTNGSNPQMVKELAEKNLVDYIAMDVKNSPAMYAQTVGLEKIDLAPIEESLRFLIGGEVDYELRTTLVSQLHNGASIQDMGQWLGSLVTGLKPKKLFLQSFVDRDTVLFAGLTPPESETTAEFAKILAPFAGTVTIRNP